MSFFVQSTWRCIFEPSASQSPKLGEVLSSLVEGTSRALVGDKQNVEVTMNLIDYQDSRPIYEQIVENFKMQIYKGMDIASAKPTEEEKKGVPHHIMDFLEPTEAFSVADYVEMARKVIADIHARGKLPVICGGTGLYINSLIDNIEFDDTGSDPAFRAEMNTLAAEKGNGHLLGMLAKVDPECAAQLHENNLKRIIRALEDTISAERRCRNRKLQADSIHRLTNPA